MITRTPWNVISVVGDACMDEAPADEFERMGCDGSQLAGAMAEAGGGEGELFDELDGTFDGALPGEVLAEIFVCGFGQEVVEELLLSLLDEFVEDGGVGGEGEAGDRVRMEVSREGGGMVGGVKAVPEGVVVEGLGAAMDCRF